MTPGPAMVPIEVEENGYTVMPEHSSIGIHAGPMYAALAILAAVIEARATGTGSSLDVAQSDSAAYFDWYRISPQRGATLERHTPGLSVPRRSLRRPQFTCVKFARRAVPHWNANRRPSGPVEQARLKGPNRGLRPIGGAQFPQDVLHVCFHRAQAHA